MIKPNLFMIGAMKAATTSLNAYLAEHPDVFMCSPREPTRFVDGRQLRDMWPRMYRAGYWSSERKYLSLFAGAGDARVIGESSTNYSKLPRMSGVAERLQRFAPAARIIYIVREPVARTISHYWHAVHREAEMRPLEQALRDEPHYMDVSYYAMQLRPYLERFGRSAVMVLTAEALAGEPERCYRDILEWLGVDSTFVPVNLQRRYHVSESDVWQSRDVALLRYLNRWGAMDIVRKSFPRSLHYHAKRVLRHPLNKRAVDTSATVAWLSRHFEPQIRELEDLLERSFPEWMSK